MTDGNDDYKIDNVPITAGRLTETRGRPQKYPWDQMQVGQSIYVDGPEAGKNASNSAWHYAARSKVMQSRAADGAILPPPEPKELTMAYILRMEAFEKEHGELKSYVVGRKKFASRRELNGWRIYRLPDVPIQADETFTIPGIPGVRWMKD